MFILSYIQLTFTYYLFFLIQAFAGVTWLEIVLKIIAFTPAEYFRSKWNAFDSLVLIIGGTELLFLDVENPILFVLRAYKLVIKIIQMNFFKYTI